MKWITIISLLLLVTVQVLAQEQADTSKGKGLSRSDIESGVYAGLLFTDVKGIRLQFNGFVQADFIYDLRDMGNKTGFQPFTISVPSLHEANTVFSVKQSRFAFTAFGISDRRNRQLKASIEMDFANSATYAPRLRHAYIQHGKWLFGQTWTNFMDDNIWPNVMDAQGPNGYILVRQPQLRFTQLTGRDEFSASVEQPKSDISIPDSTWKAKTLYPDFTLAYQRNFGESHVRISGLLHLMSYRNGKGSARVKPGGAFNFSGNINFADVNSIQFQFAYGAGYARYSEDLSGYGYDAYAHGDGLNNNGMLAGFLFYDHYWNPQLSSAIGYSYLQVNNNNAMGPDAFKSSHYAAFNTSLYFTDYFKIAAELLYGKRENINGANAGNLRLQFTSFFRF